MIGTGIGLAALTLAVGLVLVVGIRSLPTVRGRLVALAVLAVALPLAVVFLSGWVMFHMGDDVKLLAVAVAAASAALFAALLLARDLSRPIRRLSASAAQIAAGDFTVRAREDGPEELAALARSFNEMAEQVQLVFDARRELVAWASHDLRTPIASMPCHARSARGRACSARPLSSCAPGAGEARSRLSSTTFSSLRRSTRGRCHSSWSMRTCPS